MKLTNKAYDILKWVTLIFMPALVTMISSIGIALEYEHTQVIVIVLSSFTTFLGSILGVSTVSYEGDK